MTTIEDRINTAFDMLRSRGFTVNFNVESCCRGCAADEMPGSAGDQIVWTYKGQEEHFDFVDGAPVEYPLVEPECDYCAWWQDCHCDCDLIPACRPRPAEDLYVYFSGPDESTVPVGQAAYNALTGQDLTVDWNGDEHVALRILF